MRFSTLFLVFLLIGAISGCSKSEPRNDVSDVVNFSKEDDKMNAAIAEAKRTLPEFIKKMDSKEEILVAVKWAAKTSGGGVEHIWVSELTYKDGMFEGELINEPADIPGKKLGSKVKFPESEVSDWSIAYPDGHNEGGFTSKVMEEAEAGK